MLVGDFCHFMPFINKYVYNFRTRSVLQLHGTIVLFWEVLLLVPLPRQPGKHNEGPLEKPLTFTILFTATLRHRKAFVKVREDKPSLTHPSMNPYNS